MAFKLYRFHFLFPPNTLLKVLENFILILNNQFGINQHVLASHFYLFSNKENNFKLKLKYGDFRRKRKKGGKKKKLKFTIHTLIQNFREYYSLLFFKHSKQGQNGVGKKKKKKAKKAK